MELTEDDKRRLPIRNAVRELTKKHNDNGLFDSYASLAKVLDVHHSTPSGWALQPKTRACSAANAWKIAALSWNPESNDPDGELLKAKGILAASEGWDPATWNPEEAKSRLEVEREELLSRAIPKANEFDCRRLAYRAHRLAEESGFGGQPDLILRFAANFLSQASAARAIDVILNGEQRGGSAVGDFSNGGGDVKVRFFWGGGDTEVRQLMQDLADWIGTKLLGRRVPQKVFTSIEGYIECENITAKEFETFEQEVWAHTDESGNRERREFLLFRRSSDGESVHVGDLWIFTSAADQPFLATLTPYDENLHEKVRSAFRTRRIEGKKETRLLSTQSVRATRPMARMLLESQYGLKKAEDSNYLHDFERDETGTCLWTEWRKYDSSDSSTQ